jgi:hypothetical protein
MLQRDSADASSWVGTWTFMIAYRAKDMSSMVMMDIGELMFPVAAGPIRGQRYARLLLPMESRLAARAVAARPRHRLDISPGSTNNDTKEACSVVVNIFARTRLRVELLPPSGIISVNDGLRIEIVNDILIGNIANARALGRMVAPAHDISALASHVKQTDIPKDALMKGSKGLRFDPAKLLAVLEKRNSKVGQMRDEEVKIVNHDNGPLHIHVENTQVQGLHHLGVYLEGAYCPEHNSSQDNHDHHHGTKHSDENLSACGPHCSYERFTRLLNTSVAIVKEKKPRPIRRRRRAERRT